MNSTTETSTGFVATIARHLNTEAHSHVAGHAEPHAHVAPAQRAASPQAQTTGCADTNTVLYNLLMQYVELLEAADHGGWTLQEDNAVRDAVNILVQHGWKVRLPHGIA